MAKAHKLAIHKKRRMTVNIGGKYLSSLERNGNKTVRLHVSLLTFELLK